MSIKINKNGKEYDLGFVPEHYPADRVYLNGSTNNSVQSPTFTESATRTNIESGDSFTTILGKIKKFFTDLKTVAFSGSYNDLTDKPPKIQSNTRSTTCTAYGYYGWIAPATTNVIAAHADQKFLVLSKWSDGWYVAHINSTGTGFVGNETFDVTYDYYT